jgi:Ca2+-binding EF-hand superfamily protein
MKTTLSILALGLATFAAGSATAGDSPSADSPRDEMRADRDGDGRISRAEAESASSQRSGDWFDKLDLDKDGYVTQEEMRQGRETRRENMRAEMKVKMEERFKEADANGDGQLSLDEVQAKMPRLAERFNEVDKDKNGLLSKDELKHGGPGRHHQPPS